MNSLDEFDLSGHSISVLRETYQAGPVNFVTVIQLIQLTYATRRNSELQQVSLDCSQSLPVQEAKGTLSAFETHIPQVFPSPQFDVCS